MYSYHLPHFSVCCCSHTSHTDYFSLSLILRWKLDVPIKRCLPSHKQVSLFFNILINPSPASDICNIIHLKIIVSNTNKMKILIKDSVT